MRKVLINESIRTGKLQVEDYWTDKVGSISGLFLFFALWMLTVISLKFEEASLNRFLSWSLFIGLGFLFIYQFIAFINEDDLQKVYTGLDAESNLKTVTTSLENLKWMIVEKERNLIAAHISSVFCLLDQRMVVISGENYIYISVKHIGTGKGEFPSLFGLNRKRVNQLVKEIKIAAPYIV